MRAFRNKETQRLKLNIQTLLFLFIFICGGLICIYSYLFPYAENNKRRLSSTSDDAESLNSFPPLIFTHSELREWAWFLYLIGMFYSFIGIAIVCDSYFVPAIEVIVDKLNMSDDTAAATWLAAGGSTPEFATSVLGTFVAKSDVGFGTIVGSAVFNILFILGVCSMFTHGQLRLYWWSFARDMSYYLTCLSLLGIFFVVTTKGKIYWYESGILFSLYIVYIIMMKNNGNIKIWFFKKFISTQKNKLIDSKNLFDSYYGSAEMSAFSHSDRTKEIGDNMEHETDTKKKQSFIADLATIQPKMLFKHNYKMGAHQYIHGIHGHLDNVSDTVGTAEHSHTAQTYTIHTEEHSHHHHPIQHHPIHHQQPHQPPEHSHTVHTVKTIDTIDTASGTRTKTKTHRAIHRGGCKSQLTSHGTTISVYSYVSRKGKTFTFQFDEQRDDVECDEDEPVDLSFPKNTLDRILYILRAPLTFLIGYTLLDVKKEQYKKCWLCTFIGSMLWLGSLTYLMVWWAVCVGYAWGIPQEIMGLVFLAGGTSLPELLSCIIVIKKGKAAMAMSASIGSNIFDVVFNLPVPWLVYALFYSTDKYIAVSAEGLFISILALFIMMGSVFVLILINKWVLTHCMGYTMILLYAIFIAQDLVRFYFFDIQL